VLAEHGLGLYEGVGIRSRGGRIEPDGKSLVAEKMA
jgi:hypothetical protein